jgi:hypothetical protein
MPSHLLILRLLSLQMMMLPACLFIARITRVCLHFAFTGTCSSLRGGNFCHGFIMQCCHLTRRLLSTRRGGYRCSCACGIRCRSINSSRSSG